ncbi:MAG: hypothetical protein GY950_32740 [bacterium]|nr:hypothetical protein [bacterium]
MIVHFFLPGSYYVSFKLSCIIIETREFVNFHAERCLHEALRRCWKVNLVEKEADIQLCLARLDRAGYRRVLADLHLFCGQVLLEMKDAAPLLGFNARQHLQKAKEYALDVSEVSHLYQSAVSTPDFYKDFPEYDMLKRGMTDEERIENGYRVVYEIAEELLKGTDQ